MARARSGAQGDAAGLVLVRVRVNPNPNPNPNPIPNPNPNQAAVAIAGALGDEATGVAFGDNANSAICDEMMASIGSTRSQDYSQCVSDLF